LKHAGAVALGSIAARGVYEVLDEAGGRPARAWAAATVRRREEQYLVDQIEVILDNGVTVAIPPLHNDVFTAKLKSDLTWSGSALKSAQKRVEIPNGPAQVSTMDQVMQDAAVQNSDGTVGLLGHNALLQQATRLPADVVDNYGRLRPKGTAVPLREDFNTLDNPFFWSPEAGFATPNVPGTHFVAFTPASRLFHRARTAMDGVMPDGTNFREAPYSIPDENNGIDARIRASHRQNYLIPPRRHRSFPLVELLN
jgi:hypothetical protein